MTARWWLASPPVLRRVGSIQNSALVPMFASKTVLKTAAGVARRTLATETLGKGEVTQVRTRSPSRTPRAAPLLRGRGGRATCSALPLCGGRGTAMWGRFRGAGGGAVAC